MNGRRRHSIIGASRAAPERRRSALDGTCTCARVSAVLAVTASVLSRNGPNLMVTAVLCFRIFMKVPQGIRRRRYWAVASFGTEGAAAATLIATVIAPQPAPAVPTERVAVDAIVPVAPDDTLSRVSIATLIQSMVESS